MSVHISSAVWKIIMPNPGRKLVAVALADMANDDGVCWPSIRSLANRCNMRPETISDHLSALAVVGILSAQPRYQDGRQTSNLYSFAPMDSLAVIGTPPAIIGGGEHHQGGEKPDREGGEKVRGGGGRKTTPHESSEGTVIESSIIKELPNNRNSNSTPAWNPSPEQLEIGSWFNRRPTTPWSAKEKKAWQTIPDPIDPDDWAALKWFYAQSGCKFLRRDLLTLINNFTGEIDRAKNFDPNEK